MRLDEATCLRVLGVRTRPIFFILLAGLLCVSLPVLYELNYLTLKPLVGPPVALIVGATDAPSSFAGQARRGLTKAANDHHTGEVFAMEYFTTSPRADSIAWRTGLLRILARSHVFLFVSCQDSPDVPALLRIAQTFRIPTLLLVATSRQLVGDAPGICLRLPPSDEDQAGALAREVDSLETTAVLFESNIYGRGLAAGIRKALGDTSPMLEFLIDEHSEITPYLLLMNSYHCTTVIYAGYFPRAFDLIRKLNALSYQGRVLLSDGCYSARLGALANERTSVYLSFPTDPFPANSEGFGGFWGYGYDAALLIKDALPRWSRSDRSPEGLIAEIAGTADLASMPSPGGPPLPLVHSYKYSGDSENRGEHFTIYRTVKR